MSSRSSAMSRRLTNLRSLASRVKMAGDPSVFYGDPVEVESSQVSDAIAQPELASDVAAKAVIAKTTDDDQALKRLKAYDSLSINEKATITKIPALATWNATVTVNPNLGKISSANLNYFLTQSLVEYPYEGKASAGTSPAPGSSAVEITLDRAFIGTDGYVALPFFRFTIASSTLNARLGNNYSISLKGTDPNGNSVQTTQYTFQRLSATDAVFGVFVPFRQVATRTLPFMPIFGSDGNGANLKAVKITFTGVGDGDIIFVTVPGYATNEMREIAQMYNLPAGLIK